MKHFLLKTWFMLMCLFVGIGTAWATDVVYKTAKFGTQASSGTSTSYTSTYTSVYNGFSVSVANGNTNGTNWNCVKFGRKGNASIGSITTASAIDKAVTKIAITIDAITASNVNSITLYSGNSASTCTTSLGTFTKAVGTQTVTISSPTANKFYQISIDCKSGSGNGFIAVSKVDYYVSDGGSTPSVTAPTLSVAAGTYTESQNVKVSNYSSTYSYAYTTNGSTPAFDGSGNVTTGSLYNHTNGINITSSCTLKVIAVDASGNASSVTSAAYVIPQVFASLEDLVAADLTSGTLVTVSFSNVEIKDIYVTGTGYRNGVYFYIQKGGNDIEIYYQNVPAEWVAGGTLSGTMTCPWKLYSGTWELAPAADSWDWNNLSYTAPLAPKTITAIEVSGTPTKTSYTTDEAFDPTGLTVTATYSDATTAPISRGITWSETDPLVAGQTSVVVTATVDEITSAPFTVNGLTVSAALPKVTFNLSINETTTATTEKLEWVNINVTMTADKAEATIDANNYYPGTAGKSYSSTRFYTNSTLTFDPAPGINISEIIVTATSEAYATTLANSTWTNATATSDGTTATITPTNGTANIVATIGGTVGVSRVVVHYSGTPSAVLSSIALSGTYPTEFTQGGTFSHEGMIVTANYTDASNDNVTSEATFSGYDMNTLGEQTITVSYTEDEITKTAQYNITINKAPFVPTPVQEGYEVVDFTTLDPYKSLGNNGTAIVEDYEGTSFAMTFAKPQSSTTPTKFYQNGNAVRAYSGNTITITGAERITSVVMNWTVKDNNVSITGLGTTNVVVTFSMTCRFTAIAVDYRSATITLNAACHDEEGMVYGTYSNAAAWVVPEGLTVSEIGLDQGKLNVANYSTGGVVPANTGVMVSATTAGNHTIALTTAAGSSVLGTDNLLRASGVSESEMETKDADCKYYRLTMHQGSSLGFWWGAEDGAAFSYTEAGKAYLAVPTSAAISSTLWFNTDEEVEEGITTDVEHLVLDVQDGTIYDLMGRVVARPLPGHIYIQNGVKYLAK